MIRIGLCGMGRMGEELKKNLIASPTKYQFTGFFSSNNKIVDLEKLCELSQIIIDFSAPDILPSLLGHASKSDVKLVIGTTGFTQKHFDLLKKFSTSNAIFYSANMSIGASMIANISAQAAKILGKEFDIVITDFHHKHKKDAPSGTALMIADAIKKQTSGILPVSQELNSKIRGEHRNVENYLRSGAPAILEEQFVRDGEYTQEIGFSSIRAGGNCGRHEVIFASDNEMISFKHEAFSRVIFANGAIKAAEWMLNKTQGLYSMNDMFKNE
jgi:4-hydroxy-tetrahydrodipicolinate reductase